MPECRFRGHSEGLIQEVGGGAKDSTFLSNSSGDYNVYGSQLILGNSVFYIALPPTSVLKPSLFTLYIHLVNLIPSPDLSYHIYAENIHVSFYNSGFFSRVIDSRPLY